jgi:OsmC-like protein
MSDSLQRASVGVRITAKEPGRVLVFARKCSAVVGKGWSFDIAEPEVTGAEMLLGALASDVITLFLTLAKKRRLAVDEVEATVRAELLEPLAHLGVQGAEGEPRYEAFSLRAFAGSSAPEAALQAVWAEALRRAPLVNTLRRCAQFEAVLKIQL